MVERRKPLVLSSTRLIVNSVISSSLSDRIAAENAIDSEVLPVVKLPAGILRLPEERNDITGARLAFLDDSSLLGVSTSALKRLSVASGSLVLIHLLFSYNFNIFFIFIFAKFSISNSVSLNSQFC